MGSTRFRSTRIVIASCAIAWALAGTAPAVQPETSRPETDKELERLVVEALARSPEVVAAEASAKASRLGIEPAETLPDPSIAFGYQNDGTSPSLGERDMTFLSAVYAQPIPWPGKLKLAGKEAELRAQTASAAPARARLGVEARVRRAYARLLLAREESELVEERARVSRDVATLARDRYAVGQGGQQDLLRAQAEVVRLDEARVAAEAEERNALAEIRRLLRRPPGDPLEIAGRLYVRDQPDEDALVREALVRSPELAAAASDIAAGEARVELLDRERRPDFLASGGPMYRGKLDPMWQVGVGVTLPIFSRSRQKPRRDGARAEVEAAKARRTSLALDLELATRQRAASLAAAIRIAKLYAEGVLPLDRLSLESAVASYRAGKVPFVTVLEALTSVFSDRALYLARLAEADSLRASIDEAEAASPAGLSPAAPISANVPSVPSGAPMAAAGAMR